MSIAIIGGADGPTAIYLTSRISPWMLLVGALVAAAIGYAIVRMIMHK